MKVGRKPKPSVLKRIEGNPGKRAMNDREPRPDIDIPEAPDFLDDVALVEWHRVTPILKQLQIVSQLDRAALTLYCTAWSTLVRAHRKLAELGDKGMEDETPQGYRVQGVWLQIANRAAEQVRQTMIEFGMSPSSRSRVTTPEQLQMFGSGDPMNEILGAARKTH